MCDVTCYDIYDFKRLFYRAMIRAICSVFSGKISIVQISYERKEFVPRNHAPLHSLNIMTKL